MHLEGLNSQQKKAVLHKNGPILIVAGAGAGKTKTITHRILNLIKTGVAPENILAVTFTNKATKEMKERVLALMKKDKEINLPISTQAQPFISTFHALGVHIIRENAKKLQLTRNFNIFDRSDSLRAVKDAIKGVSLDPKQFEPRKILSAISKQKGNAVNLDKYYERVGNEYFPRIVASVWALYDKTLKNEKALDFDDLLLKAVELLENNPDILNHYRHRWNFMHIDEYQDTNKAQCELAALLAGKSKNICVVGDLDQNVYSWRGADIKNLLDFENRYGNVKTILLEENYRSTKTIIEASNAVIRKNKNRLEKNLFTNNESGEKIAIFSAYSEVEEAYFVAGKAREFIENGACPKDIAVLYRANFQSRILEEAFLSLSVPYQVLGVRFFERKEVKDVLSFARFALNPESIGDLKRIINVPPRGIGKITLLKIVEGKESALSSAMREKVSAFKNLIAKIKNKISLEKPSETIKHILKESGLEKTLKSGGEDDLERLENIRELATFATRYDKLPPKEGIEKLLEDAALASDQDELKEESNAVRLMTVHASKGLEFEYVFITGLEEGLFPHKLLSEENGDEEEERRLFYVALTRAKKKVFLSYASTRTIFGSKTVNIPSEFIADIDEKLLDETVPAASAEPVISFD